MAITDLIIFHLMRLSLAWNVNVILTEHKQFLVYLYVLKILMMEMELCQEHVSAKKDILAFIVTGVNIIIVFNIFLFYSITLSLT